MEKSLKLENVDAFWEYDDAFAYGGSFRLPHQA